MAIDPLEALAAAEAGTEESPQEPEAEAPQAPEQPAGVLETRFGGDVNQLERSYQELEQHLGRQGNELGKKVQALEQELQRRNEPVPEAEPEYDEGQWPDMGYDQFRDWMDTDQTEATAYLVNKAVEIAEARIRSEYKQELETRFNPLESKIQNEAADTVASGLKRKFGEATVTRYMPLLQAELEKHPEMLRGETKDVYTNMKRIITDAEWERGQAAPQSSNGQAPAPVHIEGGSQGRPVDAVGEQELTPGEALYQELTSTRIERDLFGNPKRPQ